MLSRTWLESLKMVWLHQDQTSQTKSSQTEQDQKMAGSIWLPGPEICRKLKGSWPDYARQHQKFPLCLKKDRICYLVLSGTILTTSFKFPVNFWSRKPDRTSHLWCGSVWGDFVWLVLSWCNHTIRDYCVMIFEILKCKGLFLFLCVHLSTLQMCD